MLQEQVNSVHPSSQKKKKKNHVPCFLSWRNWQRGIYNPKGSRYLLGGADRDYSSFNPIHRWGLKSNSWLVSLVLICFEVISFPANWTMMEFIQVDALDSKHREIAMHRLCHVLCMSHTTFRCKGFRATLLKSQLRMTSFLKPCPKLVISL